MNVPAIRRNQAVSQLLAELGIRSGNKFRILGSGGLISITYESRGRTKSYSLRSNGAFREATEFNPDDVTVDERATLVRELYDNGRTQTEIAGVLGVSQATISLDLKKTTRARRRRKLS